MGSRPAISQVMYPVFVQKPRTNAFKDKPGVIRVFPNPARQYLTLEYDLKSESPPAQLCIIDGKGRQVEEILLYRSRDQVIVPTGKLSDGAYLVLLKKGQYRIGAGKFTVVNR